MPRTRWSRPYLSVCVAGAAPAPLPLPQPLPLPPGAAGDPGLREGISVASLDLPDGKLQVRWRAPGFANTLKQTGSGHDRIAIVALACDVQRARDADGVGWTTDDRGRPRRTPAADPRAVTAPPPRPARPLPAQPSPPPVPADPVAADPIPAGPVPALVEVPAAVGAGASQPTPTSGAVQTLDTLTVLDPRLRLHLGPDNLMVAAVRAGRLAPGTTVEELIEDYLRARWDSWSRGHRDDMNSITNLVRTLLVYREPYEDDPADVAAFKDARLLLPGVEEDDSLHVVLVHPVDLSDALLVRRTTDLRIRRLNEQAIARWERQWASYLAAVQARADGSRRGGRMPARPADEPVLRPGPEQVDPRTEEAFAKVLAALFNHAERAGALVGPNPMRVLAPVGQPHLAYRRPVPLTITERNVAPIGRIVDLADAISACGPHNQSTGRPQGHRFRALVLAATAGPRPSELAGMGPQQYLPDPEEPALLFGRAGVRASVGSAGEAGAPSFHVREKTKSGPPGHQRHVGIAGVVAEALDRHIALGYPSPEFLFTMPGGGPLNLGNMTDTYWRPSVQRVFGGSREPRLRGMQFRWLRHAAVTWMIRAGLTAPEVSVLTGHSAAVMLRHYAGLSSAHRDLHQWRGWDDAWAWASREHDIP